MEIGWLWVALGLTWILNILLLIWLVRPRLEVWANRRVIASLKEIAHQLGPRKGSKRTSGVVVGLLLLLVVQFLFLLRDLWS
jgi:hypothetical protein